MSEEIKIFENPEFGQIRMVSAMNGAPWFVGKDVAEALGYGSGKSLANAVANHVDPADRGVTGIVTPGGFQKMVIINESGLYSLILSSKLPRAKEFKHWVTSEILPSIRKNGAYMTEPTLEKALTSPDFLIQLAQKLKDEQQARIAAENDANRMRPDAILGQAITTSKTSILIGELAKLLSQNGIPIGQNRLFEFLRQNGYLCKAKGEMYNLPTQRSIEAGWMEIKESVHICGECNKITRTPKITGKGQRYFVNLFLRKQAQ